MGDPCPLYPHVGAGTLGSKKVFVQLEEAWGSLLNPTSPHNLPDLTVNGDMWLRGWGCLSPTRPSSLSPPRQPTTSPASWGHRAYRHPKVTVAAGMGQVGAPVRLYSPHPWLWTAQGSAPATPNPPHGRRVQKKRDSVTHPVIG